MRVPADTPWPHRDASAPRAEAPHRPAMGAPCRTLAPAQARTQGAASRTASHSPAPCATVRAVWRDAHPARLASARSPRARATELRIPFRPLSAARKPQTHSSAFALPENATCARATSKKGAQAGENGHRSAAGALRAPWEPWRKGRTGGGAPPDPGCTWRTASRREREEGVDRVHQNRASGPPAGM